MALGDLYVWGRCGAWRLAVGGLEGRLIGWLGWLVRLVGLLRWPCVNPPWSLPVDM